MVKSLLSSHLCPFPFSLIYLSKTKGLSLIKTTFCSLPFIFFTDREYLHTFSRTHALTHTQNRTHPHSPLPSASVTYITLFPLNRRAEKGERSERFRKRIEQRKNTDFSSSRSYPHILFIYLFLPFLLVTRPQYNIPPSHFLSIPHQTQNPFFFHSLLCYEHSLHLMMFNFGFEV